MPVTVKFFASLRERMGHAELVLDTPAPGTVAGVWERVAGGAPLPGNVLCAVNQDYAAPGDPVRDGDEVAFFPPVTGG